MRIRKYTGRDMQEALLKVKMDLGSDAVILSSKKVKKKGIAGWFSKPVMEVLAAIDEADIRSARPVVPANRAAQAYKQQTAPIDYRDETAPRREEIKLPEASVVPEKSQTSGEVDALRLKVSNMESMLARIMQAVEPQQAPKEVLAESTMMDVKSTDSVPVSSPSQGFSIEPSQPQVVISQNTVGMPILQSSDQLPTANHEEFSQFPVAAKMQSDVVAQERRTEMTQQTAIHAPEEKQAKRVLADLKRILVEQEVEDGLADKILAKIAEKLPEPLSVDTALKACARIILAILGEPDTIKLKGTGKTTVAMLIGPTGVGKTTTLAKIAAEFAINQGKNVGLITADTYRIAAVEQLKTYAEILNVPVKVIYAPEEVRKAIHEFGDRDLILVDTAGRSHRNKAQFEELKTLISSACADEIYLVLSGNTSRSACREILDHYAFLGNYKLLFTKLDEATVPGIILNARFRTGKPLSYTTAGQTVPDDLDVANPKQLVSGIVGKMVVS
jgi:flagellar biosynthesis GTPase FlhF